MDAAAAHSNGTQGMATQKGLTGFPVKQGLYDPAYEADACGVAMIVNINGVATRKTMDDAASAVSCMVHRGAEGSEPTSGDGAGITTAIPHDLICEQVRDNAITLPEPGRYAVGNVFMSKDGLVRMECKRAFDDICARYDLEVLGYRKVPTDPVGANIGPTAVSREPVIEQVLVTPAPEARFDQQGFERRCYFALKTVENTIPYEKGFYFCSLSTRTIVYKGMLTPNQLFAYYPDLQDKEYKTHFALTHTRFSTNTFPSWDRAQPLRLLAHNGEINTLMGNKNWMKAREGLMASQSIPRDVLETLYPIVAPNGSDSAALDDVMSFLLANGVHTLPEIMMLVVPEAWEGDPHMPEAKKGFYQWGHNLMEPWDGPALFSFCDGRYAGAILDRNGLRPARYWLTQDGYLIMGSEAGVVKVADGNIKAKGRLQPGRMLLVDMENQTFTRDEDIKRQVCSAHPYGDWVRAETVTLSQLAKTVPSTAPEVAGVDPAVDARLRCHGYTLEHLHRLVVPMAENAYEALGSMGNDAPLACLSEVPRRLYDYFKQLFAQVTNPPIDPFREAVVMSLKTAIGPAGNLLVRSQEQCSRLWLDTPVISLAECTAIKTMSTASTRYLQWRTIVIDICFDRRLGARGLPKTLDRICAETAAAVDKGYRFVVLSDRSMGEDRVPISTLAAVGCLHQYLVREKKRLQIGIVAETAEAREVHHMAVLVGYGADAICPYLVFETLEHMRRTGKLSKKDLSFAELTANYIKACDTGLRKVMSKVGISTLKSYKGAQVFEIVGLNADVVARCFTGTASRIKGVDMKMLADDAVRMHAAAYPLRDVVRPSVLPDFGEYHFRTGGEAHVNDPGAIANMQDAARTGSKVAYQEFSRITQAQVEKTTLRGKLGLKSVRRIPIDEVEPASEIVKRFVTGAMSFGSISSEAHEALAVAMNRLGGRSNTGEGGEKAERFDPLPNGDSKRSSIKQVASGRFGVTIHYLTEADEIQIKMAQGAKPGEGGELPGQKVTKSIAECRMSTPGVGLISPPPHHDIYSIEDLAQLIYDLKCANPRARISVKLVSKVGVGVIASGVAKGKAEHITISGHDGGTGAASWTGIKHAGLPWELGLAEAHQTLVLNDLRGRVVLQTDGQLRTGRDIVIACLLGADEFGFATAPLIALGCIMMRKCHLNTCPVGVATQDPVLRKKFTGQPEHVINYFFAVAEEAREIMAGMGFRTMNDMLGRADMLYVDKTKLHGKAKALDLSAILVPAHELRPGASKLCVMKQDHGLDIRKDNALVHGVLKDAIEKATPARATVDIVNCDRNFGTTISHEICRRHGAKGLPEDTIQILCKGSAGQSFGAFLINGVTLRVEGDANDYVGKGLSGGKIIVTPAGYGPHFKSEENVIAGNVCCYGATSGKLFVRGIAAERFCVRNSGAVAVVEGVGDHGCEYMTGGRVVILGATGKNFAAGMSGGIAYVWDPPQGFDKLCNKAIVDLMSVTSKQEVAWLRSTITDFFDETESAVAKSILMNWSESVLQFVKVLPRDYARVMAEEKKARREGRIAHAEPTDEEITKQSVIPDIEDIVAQVAGGAKLDKQRGFLRYPRQNEETRAPKLRLKDFDELAPPETRYEDPTKFAIQTARCMDCGVPFCSSQHSGCPISNVIPKFNDLVFKGQMRDALETLLLTNNFPEFTGRVCPAPCEGACTLGIQAPAVSIKTIECAIIDNGWEKGWVRPKEITHRTNMFISIIGSGPAGLAAADQLNKAGHTVTVYERAERIGGLLMYGIPNMKLDKKIVQRRVDLMAAEGVQFVTRAEVGVTVDVNLLLRNSHALLVATGASWPRDLSIDGRDLQGIHFAMDYLGAVAAGHVPEYLNAKGKRVIVVGGGDTGNDCIGTAMRQGAASVVSFEIMPEPPNERAPGNPWPQWPKVMRVDYGHEEVKAVFGEDPRQFNTMSKKFVARPDDAAAVGGISTVQVAWEPAADGGAPQLKEVPGTERLFEADLVFLAMGFVGPEKQLLEALQVTTNRRGGINTPPKKYHTNIPRVYAAGDCRRGQSLVVWAINEGRQAARAIDHDLMYNTTLPVPGGIAREPKGPPHVHKLRTSKY